MDMIMKNILIIYNRRLKAQVRVHRAPSSHDALKALGWVRSDCEIWSGN